MKTESFLEHDLKVTAIAKSPAAKDIHTIIHHAGEIELKQPVSALFWSGLAAGLSMGLSMMAEGLLSAYLPDAEWKHLVANFGYSAGFLVVILGKQHLFTEDTLVPVLPVLHKRDAGTFTKMLRLWGVVLLANLLGALIIALTIAYTKAFDNHVQQVFAELGRKAIEPDFGTLLIRGVFAGWVIALMAWMLPYAGSAKVWVIIIMTYIVGIGHFSHVIAGAVETFTLAATHHESWGTVLGAYILPTLIGNIIGGVVLVAALNHAQVKSGRKEG